MTAFTTTRPSVDLRIQQRPSLKARVLVRFPATVNGSDGIEVTKSGNVYTIGEDFLSLTELDPADIDNAFLKVEVDGAYYYYGIDTLAGDIGEAVLDDFMTPTVITAAGDLTITSAHHYVVLNKTSGAATGITLPASAARVGPVRIKDGKGDASSNNITLTPDGSETIDGLSSWVISFDYAGVLLVPRSDGNGWWTA